MLRELGADIRARGLHFLLGGVWNMEPEELGSTGWLAEASAVVLVAPGI